jgi:hypothetical protein
MQCSCGDWVVPAIALARARVDISEPVTTRRGPGNLAPGIRLPPSMRPSGVDTSTAGPFIKRYTPVLINLIRKYVKGYSLTLGFVTIRDPTKGSL